MASALSDWMRRTIPLTNQWLSRGLKWVSDKKAIVVSASTLFVSTETWRYTGTRARYEPTTMQQRTQARMYADKLGPTACQSKPTAAQSSQARPYTTAPIKEYIVKISQ